jgi:hypothetical protein
MDVEGHEHRVLLGAKKFMKKKLKYIKGIIMEWQWLWLSPKSPFPPCLKFIFLFESDTAL